MKVLSATEMKDVNAGGLYTIKCGDCGWSWSKWFWTNKQKQNAMDNGWIYGSEHCKIRNHRSWRLMSNH